MKKNFLAIIAITILSACGNTNQNSDSLTLAYINASIYPNSAIDCQVRAISEKEIIGCKAKSLNGDSNLHLYLFSDAKFYAINGTARQAVEAYFNNRSDILLADLPLPNDLEISKVLAEFK